MLTLTACIPRSAAPPRGPETPREAGVPAGSELAARALRQCHADLTGARVGFRALDDRHFGGGCTAIGTVQLLEIGTPVTNLGAMTCPLALQFARWNRDTVQPAAARWLGAPVRRIETFGTYACRGRNGQAGARLSEHAFANAVDVSAFLLADGRRITVEQGWNGADDRVRRFLREIHDGGCRQFAIGLGPDADAFHYNHLHFDMGRGPYCR